MRLIVKLAVQEDICLYETTTKRYMLEPTIEALHHGDWDDPKDNESITSYMKLRCKTPNSRKETSTLHLRSEAGSPSIEAIFIPLGWLVEVEKEVRPNGNQQERTTHYVVLWNISTKPYSLWIVYDYRSYDEEFDLCENNLPDEGIHNKMCQHEEDN